MTRQRSIRWAVAVLFGLGVSAAEQHHHGAVGSVHFPVSCSMPARPVFEHGVALLHSFWYDEAEKTFREAANLDAACAMAWWGVAMSLYHPVWAAPARADLVRGSAALEKARSAGPPTRREADYIEAIGAFYANWQSASHKDRAAAWSRAMQQLAARYPGDREAAVFYALSLIATASPADKLYRNQKRAARILNRLLPEEPDHPGIFHYLIHTYDSPSLAALALPAARDYAKVAPAVPHALHMPSHIFTRLGLWGESISSNVASAAAAREHAAGLLPGFTAQDELHALDYLEYAYLQTGKDADAKRIVEQAASVSKVDQEVIQAAYAFASIPARYALERRRWSDASKLKLQPTGFPWARFRYAEAINHFARALGAARSGDPISARAEIEQLRSIRSEVASTQQEYDWATQVEVQRLGAEAWVLHAEGRHAEALAMMRSAAALEDKVDKHPVTPGPVLPARELLADMLMEMDNPGLAIREFDAVLRSAPNRFNALYGSARASELSGQHERARRRYEQLLAVAAGANGRALEVANARAYLKRKDTKSEER
jgi:tetratricopeptide (TPR) repeat protein